MAQDAMITFLAAAAQEARVKAERKPIHIAVAGSERDPSTIYRFEKGQWPRNPDAMIEAYAEELNIEPIELWQRAIELWRGDADSRKAVRPQAPGGGPGGAASQPDSADHEAEALRAAADAVEQEQKRGKADAPKAPRKKRPGRAA